MAIYNIVENKSSSSGWYEYLLSNEQAVTIPPNGTGRLHLYNLDGHGEPVDGQHHYLAVSSISYNSSNINPCLVGLGLEVVPGEGFGSINVLNTSSTSLTIPANSATVIVISPVELN